MERFLKNLAWNLDSIIGVSIVLFLPSLGLLHALEIEYSTGYVFATYFLDLLLIAIVQVVMQAIGNMDLFGWRGAALTGIVRKLRMICANVDEKQIEQKSTETEKNISYYIRILNSCSNDMPAISKDMSELINKLKDLGNSKLSNNAKKMLEYSLAELHELSNDYISMVRNGFADEYITIKMKELCKTIISLIATIQDDMQELEQMQFTSHIDSLIADIKIRGY